MAYINGVISETGNVTYPDMQMALGTNLEDLGALCQHPSLNKKSRHKPYAFGGILPNGLYGKKGFDDTILINNNFGMVPKCISLPDNSGAIISGCDPDWEQWSPPKGGKDSIFRSGDFRGYWKDAGDHIISYEILTGPDLDPSPYLQVSARSKTKIVLKFENNSRIVQLTDFNWKGTPLADMYLTLIVANHRNSYGEGPNHSITAQWGQRIIFKQSDKSLVEAIGNTNPGEKVLEVMLDTSNVTEEQRNQFQNANQFYADSRIFIAVGLAVKLPTTGNVSSFGNGYLVEAGGTMPFDLVDFNMYNNRMWTVAAIQPDFTQNAVFQTYTFDVPCRLVAYRDRKTLASFDRTKCEITVNLNTAYTISVESWRNPELDKHPEYMQYGQLGLAFGIYIHGGDSRWDWEQIGVDKWYIIATNMGLDQRGVSFENGELQFRGDIDNVSNNDQMAIAELKGMEMLPTSGGIKINCPEAANYSRLMIEIDCFIEPILSSDGNNRYQSVIVSSTGNIDDTGYIEKVYI